MALQKWAANLPQLALFLSLIVVASASNPSIDISQAVSDGDLLQKPELVPMPQNRSTTIVDAFYDGKKRRYKRVLKSAFKEMDSDDVSGFVLKVFYFLLEYARVGSVE
jgi:hypothetical protein